MKHAALLLLLSLIAGITGCAPSFETRTFQITVDNKSSKSVSVWLTKDGPAYEAGWQAPEELANSRPTNEAYGFQQIPPGKSADTGQVSGQFSPSTHAILRLYVGQLTFDEILAVNSRSPNRIEVPLKPGKNAIVLTDDRGLVKAENLAP